MNKTLNHRLVILLKSNHYLDEQLFGIGYLDNKSLPTLLDLKEGVDDEMNFIITNKKLLTIINLINSITKRKYGKMVSSKVLIKRLANTANCSYNNIRIDGVSIKLDEENKDRIVGLHKHYLDKLIYSKPIMVNDFTYEEAMDTYALISETINTSIVIWKSYYSKSDKPLEDFLSTVGKELNTILTNNTRKVS